MKKFINEMSFRTIRMRLNGYGVHLTDEQFDGLTYKELKTIFRKAEKIDRLQDDIQQIVDKPKKLPNVKKGVDK